MMASSADQIIPQATDQPFRFFDLAQETRDTIYGYCTRSLECKVLMARDESVNAVHVGTFTAPAMTTRNLLLVSQRFKNEYEAEIFRHTELTVACACGSKPGPIIKARMGGMLPRLRSVKVVYTMTDLNLTSYAVLQVSARSIVAPLPKLLPSLSSIQFEVKLDLCLSDFDDTGPPLSPFFDENIVLDGALSNDSAPIAVEKALSIKSALYNSYSNLVTDGSISGALNDSPANHITYQAYPASTEPSWMGVDLVTESAGTFDWDDAVRVACYYKLDMTMPFIVDEDEDDGDDDELALLEQSLVRSMRSHVL